MSGQTIALNSAPAEPSLKDLLDLLKKDILLSLSCHHVATVQSFDAENQTATATVNYTKTYFQLNAVTGLYDAVQVNYPILVDCPAIVLGGGAAALTFPITKGDECLVLFNDRDMDNWYSGGAGAAVATPRLHSFSDGIILVGLRSMANVIDNYDAVRAVLRNGQALVGVGSTLVKIANNSTTLNTLLQSLVNAIKALAIDVTVTGVSPGVGTASGTGSVDPSSTSALSTIATNIAGLLE